MRVTKLTKHTYINNLRWWGASYAEYLAPSHKKFIISFSIGVVAMGQRWGALNQDEIQKKKKILDLGAPFKT